MVKVICTISLACGLAFATAAGAATPGVCVKANGKKVQCADFVPRGTASPVPTRSPAPTVKPPACSDHDRFQKDGAKRWTKEVELEVGVDRILCVDLPAGAFPFYEIYTINRENSSCSNLEMTAIAPDGTYRTDVGPAPVLRPNVQAGRWLLKLTLPWGCTKYQFNIGYPG